METDILLDRIIEGRKNGDLIIVSGTQVLLVHKTAIFKLKEARIKEFTLCLQKVENKPLS